MEIKINIFYIDENPRDIAKSLVDKHCVKMPLESAQMLSTAHRLLDGTPTVMVNDKKKKLMYLLDGESCKFDELTKKFTIMNSKCYQVAHAKHPSTVWTMLNKSNYDWHFDLFSAMLSEYTSRYGKKHQCEKLLPFLKNSPVNIRLGNFTPPTPAMPDRYKVDNILESYRSYYAGDKWRFAKWKHGSIPEWFLRHMQSVWSVGISDRSQMISDIAEKYGNKSTLPLDGRIFSFGNKLCYDKSISEIQKNS